MKKRHIIGIIIILIILLGIITYKSFFLNSRKNSKNIDERKRSELNIISEYKEYMVAIDNVYSEMETFAVFKNVEHDIYQKVFSLGEFNLEGRFICWNNDKLYILKDVATAYELSNGNIIYTGDLNKLLNNTTGSIDRILGIKGNYIYYEFSYNGDFYGRVTLDFKSVEIIQKQDIPKNFN